MISIGIDIGTTTVCAVAADILAGKILFSETLPNDSFIEGADFEKIQNPEKILKKVEALLEKALELYPETEFIGFTGQMHGIVYIDKDGNAVSPLYTWQDGRGGQLNENGISYAEELSEITGFPLASGFGNVTHYYNKKNGLVHEDAVCYTTIHSLAAMKVAGNLEPTLHTSDAASLGLFNIESGAFSVEAFANSGLDISLLPKVISQGEIIGEHKGIPVCVAIGDNQASFLGSVKDDSALLINIGTGAQVSFVSCAEDVPPDGELRPLLGNGKIAVGSSLCGGRAYALLKNFFKRTLASFGHGDEDIYSVMNRLAVDGRGSTLSINTQFCGTRLEPQKRGSITNLSVDNFTPEAVCNGVLSGIAGELFELYLKLSDGVKPKQLVGSGNAVRQCEPLRRVISEMFTLPLLIPETQEEAAFGAAIVAAGNGEMSLSEIRSKAIKYIDL